MNQSASDVWNAFIYLFIDGYSGGDSNNKPMVGQAIFDDWFYQWLRSILYGKKYRILRYSRVFGLVRLIGRLAGYGDLLLPYFQSKHTNIMFYIFLIRYLADRPGPGPGPGMFWQDRIWFAKEKKPKESNSIRESVDKLEALLYFRLSLSLYGFSCCLFCLVRLSVRLSLFIFTIGLFMNERKNNPSNQIPISILHSSRI